MKNEKDSKTKSLTKASLLRTKAEERLAKMSLKPNVKQPEYDLQRINHELLVHQIELEMQNNELVQAYENLEQITEKYIELYNLAPLGYFSLTKEGVIIESNIYGAHMFKKNIESVIGSQFVFFVADLSKLTFNLFLAKTFTEFATENCLATLDLENSSKKHVLLTGNATRDRKHCLIAAIDITEHIDTESKLKQLEQFNSYFIDRELRMAELKKEINDLLEKGGSEKKY